MTRGMGIFMMAGAWLILSGFSLFEAEDAEIAAGNAEYADQEYADALGHYDRAAEQRGDDPVVQYNRGNALTKQGNSDEAMEAYLKALTGADDALKAKNYYNMGNLLLKQGKLSEAIDSYKRSLKLVSGDRDVIFNLELAQHVLEEQKKKQQEQKENQDQQNQDQQQQDQQQQDQQQQDQQQQDQQQQDQQQQDQQQQDQQQQDQQQQDQQQQDQQQQDQQQQQEGQGEQKPSGAADQEQQAQEVQAQPIEKSEAEELLDKLRKDEKAFQMHRFMLEQAQPRNMEQDW